MLAQFKRWCIRRKRAILHTHTSLHTVYWIISAVSGHSVGYMMLASGLAVLTVTVATLEESE